MKEFIQMIEKVLPKVLCSLVYEFWNTDCILCYDKVSRWFFLDPFVHVKSQSTSDFPRFLEDILSQKQIFEYNRKWWFFTIEETLRISIKTLNLQSPLSPFPVKLEDIKPRNELDVFAELVPKSRYCHLSTPFYNLINSCLYFLYEMSTPQDVTYLVWYNFDVNIWSSQFLGTQICKSYLRLVHILHDITTKQIRVTCFSFHTHDFVILVTDLDQPKQGAAQKFVVSLQMNANEEDNLDVHAAVVNTDDWIWFLINFLCSLPKFRFPNWIKNFIQ
jgi:hypothetical protein